MRRPKGLRCFIYLRKSRQDVEEERRSLDGDGDTLKRHRQALLKLAKKEDHTIVDIFEEIVSGESISERPEVQKMLRRVENNEVDAILVMDFERLGRGDMYDMGHIYRVTRYSGTLVVTPTEVIDPKDESSELLFGIRSLISREELKTIIKRMQRGRQASVLEGKSISKKPPYGYIRNEYLKLEPDPERAWVVEFIFKKIADGLGRVAVAQELDAMGVKPPHNGSCWAPSTLTHIIKNEVYLGHLIWGKFEHTKLANGEYKRRRTTPDEWIRHDNAHPPLVSQELWETANQEHSRRHRMPVRPNQGLANPLSGILVCAICGRTVARFPRPNRPNDNLRCKTPTCKGVQAGAVFSLVEERILQGLEEIVGEFEFDETSTDTKRRDSEIAMYETELKQKRARRASIMDQKSNLHELLEQGVYDVDTFMERSKVVNDKLKEIEGKIINLEVEIERLKEYQQKNNEFAPRVKSVLKEYHATEDPKRKNRLLKSVLEKVTYRRKPEWKDSVDHFELELYPLI